jgi:ubiquinol-cytochrome c reductase cytochrome b subunit
LVVTLVLEAVTGIALSMAYAPTATDAWGSIYFIENQVMGGSLLRGLHHFGSHVLVVLCTLYLCQVVLVGAYRAPREVTWLSALLLFGLVLALARTGHLLPYDQKAYWSTKVPTNIAGSVPLVGDSLKALAQGGSDFGSFTLTRFYGLHVAVLPVLLLLVVIGLRALSRRHGWTSARGTKVHLSPASSRALQSALNGVTALVTVGVLFALALVVGVALEAPADPSSQYEARPEWYYLSLFHLLKWFEGPLYVVGTVILPGAVTTFVVAIPWIDRGTVVTRRVAAGGFFAVLAGIATLSGLALAEDAGNSDYQAAMNTVMRNASEASAYAADPHWGIDAAGRVVLYEGKKIFRREKCAECHAFPGETTEKVSAPSLEGYLSRSWLHRVISDPNHEQHFGLTKLKYDEDEGTGMEGYASLGEPVLSELVEFVASLSAERYEPPIDTAMAKRGAAHFEEECSGCHDLEGDASVGPQMLGYGGMKWLSELLVGPSHERFYGELGDGMPKYDHLSTTELESLAAWLVQLRFETVLAE